MKKTPAGIIAFVIMLSLITLSLVSCGKTYKGEYVSISNEKNTSIIFTPVEKNFGEIEFFTNNKYFDGTWRMTDEFMEVVLKKNSVYGETITERIFFLIEDDYLILLDKFDELPNSKIHALKSGSLGQLPEKETFEIQFEKYFFQNDGTVILWDKVISKEEYTYDYYIEDDYIYVGKNDNFSPCLFICDGYVFNCEDVFVKP